jgi:hypothetical protein
MSSSTYTASDTYDLPVVAPVAARRGPWIAFLLYLALGVFFTLPGSLHPNSALLGFVGDNYQHAWFLWHFSHAVTHFQNPFHTRLIFYPNDVNLAWSTTDPLAGILALPISLLAGPVVAYNFSLILQLALAAYCARLICLRACRNEAAAFIGGLCFGFSPFMLAQALGHLSLVTTFPIPLYLLALVAVLERESPGTKEGVYLGLTLLLTALAHYNYTVICLLMTPVIIAIDLRACGAMLLRKIWKPILWGALTFLVLFSPLLVMLVGNRADIPRSRSTWHFDYFSADVFGLLIPSWNHLVLGRFAHSLNADLFIAGYEGTVYVGIFILVFALVGLWKGRTRNELWTIRALASALVFYFFSLGPHLRFWGKQSQIPGPAALFYKVGFAKFVSAPARFEVVTALGLAILASLGFAFILERITIPSWRYLAASGLVALLLSDLLTVPFPQASTIEPAWSSMLAPREAACAIPPQLQKGTLLTFPMIDAPYSLESMWLQVRDQGRFSLVDGYVSYAADRLWANFYEVPVVRSLLTLQGRWNFPADPIADRKVLPDTIRYLNLSAIVVFDSPEKSTALEYLKKLTNEEGMNAGSCVVFPVENTALVGGPSAVLKIQK